MARRPLRRASPSGVLPHRSSTLTSASYLQGGHHGRVAKAAVCLDKYTQLLSAPMKGCCPILQMP